MNSHLIYFPILIIALSFTLSQTTIEPFNSAIGQVDPFQEQIEPIPPSNNTNNQTTHIVFSSQ